MAYIRTIANPIGGLLVVVGVFTTAIAPSVDCEARRGTVSGIALGETKPTEADETVEPPEPARLTEATVSGGTPEQRQLTLWALQRFEDAGLGIPSVDIHLHQDLAHCNGNRGIFSCGSQRIDVCVTERNVVLHEIAHAWNLENLSESQRS
ncbi:MAG: hypothetical protein QNL12_01990, partial [Acidimicrobiia bacterium]|nr:hypothetical protein [Acidimicrobiia bacterium]